MDDPIYDDGDAGAEDIYDDDDNYVDDQEQPTQDDLELSEFHDDLDTDIIGDLTSFEKELRTTQIEQVTTAATTASAASASITATSTAAAAAAVGKSTYPVFKTRNTLTKYEKTALLGVRAEQLRRGAPPYVPLEEKDQTGRVIRILNDEDEIAKKELAAGVLPLMIDRPLPSNTVNRPTYNTVSLRTLIHSTNPNF